MTRVLTPTTGTVTAAQLSFATELRESYRTADLTAIVTCERDDYSDDGAAIVTLTYDGATQSCWVDREGQIIGDWL